MNLSRISRAPQAIACAVVCLLALAVGLGGCKSATGKPSPARESQEDDIREAVFRWQFAHNASSQQQSAKVYS